MSGEDTKSAALAAAEVHDARKPQRALLAEISKFNFPITKRSQVYDFLRTLRNSIELVFDNVDQCPGSFLLQSINSITAAEVRAGLDVAFRRYRLNADGLNFTIFSKAMLEAVYPNYVLEDYMGVVTGLSLPSASGAVLARLSSNEFIMVIDYLNVLTDRSFITEAESVAVLSRIARARYRELYRKWSDNMPASLNEALEALQKEARITAYVGLGAAAEPDPEPGVTSFVASSSAPHSTRAVSASAGRAVGHTVTCARCNRTGHDAVACFSPRCAHCKMIGHDKSVCKNRTGSKKPASANVITTSLLGSDASVDKEKWIVDTGASRTMTGNKDLLVSNINPLPPPGISVRSASGQTLHATHTGTVKLLIPTAEVEADGSMSAAFEKSFDNVLFVPSLKFNLLSPKQSGAMVHIEGAQTSYIEWKQVDGERVRVSLSEDNGGLFTINKVVSFSTASLSLTRLHQRLGHLNYADLLSATKLAKQPLSVTDKTFCETCAQAKSHRATVSNKADERETKPGELIHCDIAGPSEEAGQDGQKYAIEFIDDASRMVFVYTMTSKTQAVAMLDKFSLDCKKAGITLQPNCIFQSDNDSVMAGCRGFLERLHALGLVPRTCPPHTPAMNGVAERQWRTLKEMARAMLLDAGLPKRFWPQAIQHAAYLRNRSPHAYLGGVSPFFKIKGKHPTFERLRVFGSPAYVNDASTTLKTWDSKAKKGVFVGFSDHSTAYKICFDSGVGSTHERFTTVESIHVTFNEKNVINHSPAVVFEETVQVPTEGAATGPKEGAATGPTAVQPGVKATPTAVPADRGKPAVATSPGPAPPTAAVPPMRPVRGTALTAALADTINPDQQQQLEADEPVQSVQTAVETNFSDDGELHPVQTTTSKEPRSLRHSSIRLDADLYLAAYNDELQALRDSGAFVLVPENQVPEGAQLLRPVTVFTRKLDAEGNFLRVKARICVDGGPQTQGVDFEESYAPVAETTTFRILLSLAAHIARHAIVKREVVVLGIFVDATKNEVSNHVSTLSPPAQTTLHPFKWLSPLICPPLRAVLFSKSFVSSDLVANYWTSRGAPN